MKRVFAPFAAAGYLLANSRDPGARITVTLANFVVTILVAGVVLNDFWAWFVAPLAGRDINYVEAVGLLLVMQTCRIVMIPIPPENVQQPRIGRMLLFGIVKCIALGMLWTVGALWAAFAL